MLRADIVDAHDETTRVGGHEFLHAGEVLGFAFGGERHLLDILMIEKLVWRGMRSIVVMIWETSDAGAMGDSSTI